MSKLVMNLDAEYLSWIKELSQRYRQSQIKAAVKVNEEMLKFYWELGRDIVEKKAENLWPDNFWNTLPFSLQQELPSVKGLSVSNLQYTKRFFLLYNKLVSNNPQVVGVANVDDPQVEGALFRIPWSHHRYI